MKLVIPADQRGGQIRRRCAEHRTCRLPPSGRQPRHRFSGGALWLVIHAVGMGQWGRDYSPFSLLGISCEKSFGGHSSSSSTKPVGPQYLLIIADPAPPPARVRVRRDHLSHPLTQ